MLTINDDENRKHGKVDNIIRQLNSVLLTEESTYTEVLIYSSALL